MRAFKFRAANQVALALDIIINKRLYCADWKTLNDPMEGNFGYFRRSTKDEDGRDRISQIIEGKQGLKVCSLSESFDSHLLWAHYAGGFDGMAIEVELPEYNHIIRKVSYDGGFKMIDLDNSKDSIAIASEILSSKYFEWKYEREVRILQREQYFNLDKPVVRVIAGHRMPPALFESMNLICTAMKIKFCRVGIGDEGIDADYVPPSTLISLN